MCNPKVANWAVSNKKIYNNEVFIDNFLEIREIFHIFARYIG